MGWLWASPSPPKSPAPGETAQNSSQTPNQTPSASNKPSDSDIDPEIQKFMSLFQSDTTIPDAKQQEKAQQPPASSSTTPSSSSSSSTSGLSSWLSLKSSPTTNARSASASEQQQEAVPELDPVGESLLPTDMSCRQAFDMAFYCQSVGGQWNSIYREGSVRSCSDHWNDFWACMRIKGYQGPMREAAVREHYRRKEHEKYGPGMPSSQDVWQPRAAKVTAGTAFTTTLEVTPLEDEEWQRLEMERRRGIREKLGFKQDSQAAA